MAISRKLVAQDEDENSWLKVDHSSRFIQNHSEEWQFLFGPNSELSTSSPIIKIAAKFDQETFSNIQITAYLYDQKNAAIANSGACTVSIFNVTTPDWTEQHISTISCTKLSNNYYYTNPTTSSIGLDFQGGDTIMIEATITRLGVVYRDRVYVNHMGIFENITKLKQEVEFLAITKKDI